MQWLGVSLILVCLVKLGSDRDIILGLLEGELV